MSIARPLAEVYAFVRDGANLPRWASGLGESVEESGDAWLADGPLGRVTVRFAPRNPFGVLDHEVTLPSGVTVHNPLRAIPNGSGCTLTFTLMRAPGEPADKLAADRAWVERDLQKLAALLA